MAMDTTHNRTGSSSDSYHSYDVKPSWWNDTHTSGWDRVKAAFRRDWEQTKRDFGADSAPELNQDVGDTVKQAVGKQAIPPGNVPNPPDADDIEDAIDDAKDTLDDFGRTEPAMRYGYGASSYYSSHKSWDDKLESQLRSEWDGLNTGRGWDDVRGDVRRGFDYGRR